MSVNGTKLPTLNVRASVASLIGRPQAFCPECGTPIYSTTVADDPKSHAIRPDSCLHSWKSVSRQIDGGIVQCALYALRLSPVLPAPADEMIE